jgi:hypothetical protein
MIETRPPRHMQIMARQSPPLAHRCAPRALSCLTLALALAACEGGAGEGEGEGSESGDTASSSLDCDEAPVITGAATFEGQAESFDNGSVVFYMNGTPEQPCINFVEVTVKGETAAMELFLSPPEGGGSPLELTGVNFGGPVSPGDYGVYPEDIPKFTADVELGEMGESCTAASFEVTGTDARMYLSGSEDWGPYMLTDVGLSVSGPWSIEWLDGACQ